MNYQEVLTYSFDRFQDYLKGGSSSKEFYNMRVMKTDGSIIFDSAGDHYMSMLDINEFKHELQKKWKMEKNIINNDNKANLVLNISSGTRSFVFLFEKNHSDDYSLLAPIEH